MTNESPDDKADQTRDQLREAILNASELDVEDRLKVFESLFGAEGDLRDAKIPFLSDGMSVACKIRSEPFRPFRTEDVEVSDDGRIILRPPNVFVSHSHADKRIVRNLARQLETNNVSVWLDEAELNFGDSLIGRLRDAIDTVDVLLAVLSRNSIDSSWVQKEIEIAMTEEIQKKRVKVVPIVIDDIPLPGFLVGKFYADFRTAHKRSKNLTKLVASIQAHTGSSGA